MAAKLGTTDVSFRLGSATPAAVYLGSVEVWSAVTVPGAPTIVSAVNAGGGIVVTFTAPASDGGAAITSYAIYEDGVLKTTSESTESPITYAGPSYAGEEIQIAAINAIGEGAKSNAVVATA